MAVSLPLLSLPYDVPENCCAGCRAILTNRLFLGCKLCYQNYDLECANISKERFLNIMSEEQKENYECPACMCKKPKNGNHNNPVGRQDNHISIVDLIDADSSNVGPEAQFASNNSSEHVTFRNRQRKDAFVAENTFMDELVRLSSVRAIIRDEFERIIDQRLVKLFSKYDEEQTTRNIKTQQALNGISEKVTLLEQRVNALECELASKSNETFQQTPVITIEKDNLKVRKPLPTTPKQKPSSTGKDTSDLAKLSEKQDQEPVQCAVTTVVPAAPAGPSLPTLSGDSYRISNNTSVINEKNIAYSKIAAKPKRSLGFLRGSAPANESLPQLMAAEQQRYIHLCYVQMGTSDQQVKDYVNAITGAGTCSVESLKARGQYASFKIGVPTTLYDSVMEPEKWPINVCIKPWSTNFRLRRDSEQKQ